MGLLLVGIIASTAISEALAHKLFDCKEVPQTQQNAAEWQPGGAENELEGSEVDNANDNN